MAALRESVGPKMRRQKLKRIAWRAPSSARSPATIRDDSPLRTQQLTWAIARSRRPEPWSRYSRDVLRSPRVACIPITTMRAFFFELGVAVLAGCAGRAGSSDLNSMDSGLRESGVSAADADDDRQEVMEAEAICQATPAGDADLPGAPLYHRPARGCCPTQRGSGTPGLIRCTSTTSICTGGTCWADSDCAVGGTNGRCIAVQLAACSYDECFSDQGCPSQVPCVCRASPDDSAPNVCATGSQCAVDSDCGPGGFCSPSPSPAARCPFAGSPGIYACHTANDTCTNDSDCASYDAGGAPPPRGLACTYDLTAQHWACIEMICVLP
jgi:hypothetical protein